MITRNLYVVAFFVAFVTVLLLAVPARAAACAGIEGKASFYCCEHHGRATASGEIFNQNAMTAAMAAKGSPLVMGGRYRVSRNGRSVEVRITDTGGFAKYGRLIDLSKGAFAKLAHPDAGVIRVCVERL